ncbi:MAG: Vir protein, partial [Prevotellaceae bacterium]|nr:Vir protein [Prevotellaceae bacterium]
MICSFLLLSISCLYAGAPEYLSYQAVVRDATGKVQENKPVGIRISILQGNENGAAVYREVHAATSNANGLVNLQIGNGTGELGAFAAIDWAAGAFFVKTE